MSEMQAVTGGVAASLTFFAANRVQAYQNLPPIVRAAGGAVGTWASRRFLKGHMGAAVVGVSAATAVDGAMDLLGL